ncbi:MAG: short-chain dehydrogenase/reductase SDR [Candidatus Aramenus sulfurataquae]|jgi:short-subunit dehydrogenase|uniref:3-oxoacyl-ACP reductase n=2 Tax=Candidatus Aramenus sulfurataquae TaxID=1326980 RepID=W7KIM4_9CREN|nr:MAG: short-chain dehydrogenase/reductase SDR [Candidatus Aramenus sulfurataquae]MCL7343968.1 SDR family oxidoreductase [Candidatus Aramenus sulfurataquae]
MIAIVTGASKGIGKSVAIRLKKLGYTVVAVSRTPPEVGDVNYAADVSNKEEVKKIVEETLEKFSTIDVLVNNAGFGVYGSFHETPLEEEEYMVKTNLLGPIYFTKFVLPSMISKRRGNIINIISEAAYVSSPKLLVYSATKAGLASFTNGLWAEARKFNVKVSGIYPGPVKTNFSSHPSFKGVKNSFDKFAVEPEKVADAVVKAIKTGKREIYVPSKLLLDPYFLKFSNLFQSITYGIVSKWFS